MDQDFKTRYAEETNEHKSRIKNLSLSFRNSKLFDPLMGASLASVTTCFGVGGYALTVRSYPSLANTILMVSNGAGGGVMSGSFAALVFETFADSLDEWYGHEYGQAVRLLGVAAGGASVVAGVVSAAGVFSFGLGLFTPVFFITFGLTLGGTCLYRWNARRRSTECLQSMRKVCDAIHALYQSSGQKVHEVWEIIKYVQRKSLRIPMNVAIAIMQCASSNGRLQVLRAYMDSLYNQLS